MHKVGSKEITIYYDEAIENKISYRDFEVKDYTIDEIEARVVEGTDEEEYVVIITLNKEIKEGTTSIKLTQEYAVKDKAGNESKLDKTVDVTVTDPEGGE